MFDELSHITLSGKEYPLKCDLCVLEKLQDEFRNIDDFEHKITGWQGEEEPLSMPDVKAVNSALYWMVREGLEIEAEEKKTSIEIPKKETLLRMVDEPYFMLSKKLHNEFVKCFISKNQSTTQGGIQEN